MAESSGESDPPRVTVRLPRERPVRGALLGWRQAPDGTWWAKVTAYVPAVGIEQEPGQDYRDVPREHAKPPDPQYVLTNLPPGANGQRLVLHEVGKCWDLTQDKLGRRVTPVKSAQLARSMLLMPDTTACDLCNPDP